MGILTSIAPVSAPKQVTSVIDGVSEIPLDVLKVIDTKSDVLPHALVPFKVN